MYVQYRKPNSEALAALISDVRGERTLVKFADDIKRTTPSIKVSASTLSRACNCGDNPVSYELLEAIAAVSGNRETTLAQLLEANGTRSQEDDQQLAKKTVAEARRDRIMNIRRMTELVIQDEIAKRDYSMMRLPGYFNGATLNGYIYQADRVFPRNYDFGFSVSGMSPCSTWKFGVCPHNLSDSAGTSSIEAYVGNLINRFGAVFAGDSMESELYESEKYSFVFVDEKIYRAFLKRLDDHDIQVNGLMTAILLDAGDLKFIEETQLKRTDGAEASSFFKQPIVRETEDADIVAFEDTDF